jgi:predicted dehydrogenase
MNRLGSSKVAAGGDPLRIGILGAARIAELAMVKPSRATGTRLVAIAARDRRRAEAYATAHGVDRALSCYSDVLGASDVEAVYNPLPNALHAVWNQAAIKAGKHVLSEKPFAANADEAAEVRDVARRTGVVVMEGFHYRYHPVTHRLHELLDSGELGELVSVETVMMIRDPGADDPRWSLPLAGGALMDLGCYSLHAQRLVAPWAGGEPCVTAARAGERDGAPGIDEWLDADLIFPSGATGSARCHMAANRRQMQYRIIGTRGEAKALCFVEPHTDDRVVITTAAGERVEKLGTRSSYTYQLEAFIAAVRTGAAVPTDPDDAVATMRLIDDCYWAAGLRPRQTSTTRAEPPPDSHPRHITETAILSSASRGHEKGTAR